jgi:OOP family OmpA-OmpF porin
MTTSKSQGTPVTAAANDYNMALSQRRADAVRDYAIAQGIQPERITTKAYGETMPAVPNTDEANRKLNRRITFVQ